MKFISNKRSGHLKVSINCLQSINSIWLWQCKQKNWENKKNRKTGVYNADVACYMQECSIWFFQKLIQKLSTIKQPAYLSYKDKETLDFELILNKNYYTNTKSIHVCFLIRFRKSINATANLGENITAVTQHK